MWRGLAIVTLLALAACGGEQQGEVEEQPAMEEAAPAADTMPADTMQADTMMARDTAQPEG